MTERLERMWSAQNAVNKYARKNGLKARLSWGFAEILAIVPDEKQWNEWLKHLQDIDPEYQGTWEFHEARGTIAAVPVVVALYHGRRHAA